MVKPFWGVWDSLRYVYSSNLANGKATFWRVGAQSCAELNVGTFVRLGWLNSRFWWLSSLGAQKEVHLQSSEDDLGRSTNSVGDVLNRAAPSAHHGLSA